MPSLVLGMCVLDNNPVMCTHDWACVYACAYWSLLPKNYPPLLFPLVIIWSMDVGLRIVMLNLLGLFRILEQVDFSCIVIVMFDVIHVLQ